MARIPSPERWQMTAARTAQDGGNFLAAAILAYQACCSGARG
ncbi:hypothetical protein [Oleomonas cavernae]|nr:hypothetical protein [Oleomonas cavernae]